MKNLFLIPWLMMLSGCGTMLAQETITVNATGEVQVPADLIDFRITISVTGDAAEEVFEEHKRQETYLSGLIREHGLEGQLTFQPMSIGTRQIRDSRQIASTQNVLLELSDFTLFEEIQVLLIENGFENFHARFSSTALEEAQEEALDLAVKNALEKVDVIAGSLGRSTGRVQSVEQDSPVLFREESMRFADMQSSTGAMTEFNQRIPVSVTIRLVSGLE